MGRKMVEVVLFSWIKESWVLVLGYIPKFYILSCGWMGFLFRIEEVVKTILVAYQRWGVDIIGSKLFVTIYVLERIVGTPIWVKLFGFPLEF
jgi:hypothetical protein